MIVGMDVHRNRTQVCVVDGEGKDFPPLLWAIWPRRGWHPRGSRAAPVAGGAAWLVRLRAAAKNRIRAQLADEGIPVGVGFMDPGRRGWGAGSVHHAHHRCVVSALIGGGRDSHP